MSSSPLDLIRKVPIAGSALDEAEKLERRVKSHRRLPVPLYIAEVFLFLVIAVYFSKLCVLTTGIVSGYSGMGEAIVVYIVDAVMMIATLSAVLGITSRDPASWRKVMRSALLLFLFSLIGYFTATGETVTSLFIMNPLIIAVICIPVGAIMMLRSIREYYLPPMHDMPPLGRWAKYMLFTPLLPAGRYEIAYD